MVKNLLHQVKMAKKSKISIFCVGVIQFFFEHFFLDVFFDADSNGIWVFDFGPPGAEKSRFFWFWTPHREILLSHFFKKSKICSKVAQTGLILFRILHWLLCCSLFGSSSYHLRKNCQKPPKNRPKFTFCDSIFSKLGSKSKNRRSWRPSYAYGLSNTPNNLILSFLWSKICCI